MRALLVIVVIALVDCGGSDAETTTHPPCPRVGEGVLEGKSCPSAGMVCSYECHKTITYPDEGFRAECTSSGVWTFSEVIVCDSFPQCIGKAPTCRKGTIGKTCGNETWEGGCFEGRYWTCTNMPGGIPAAECGCIAASSGTSFGDPCPSDGGLDVGSDAAEVADVLDG